MAKNRGRRNAKAPQASDELALDDLDKVVGGTGFHVDTAFVAHAEADHAAIAASASHMQLDAAAVVAAQQSAAHAQSALDQAHATLASDQHLVATLPGQIQARDAHIATDHQQINNTQSILGADQHTLAAAQTSLTAAQGTQAHDAQQLQNDQNSLAYQLGLENVYNSQAASARAIVALDLGVFHNAGAAAAAGQIAAHDAALAQQAAQAVASLQTAINHDSVNLVGDANSVSHAQAVVTQDQAHVNADNQTLTAQQNALNSDAAQEAALRSQLAQAQHNIAGADQIAITQAEHALSQAQAAVTNAQAAVAADIPSVISAIDKWTGEASQQQLLDQITAIAAATPASQAAMTAEIAKLVTTGVLNADYAITTLTSLAAGQTNLQTTVNAEITGLVAAGVVGATHVIDVLTSARVGLGVADATVQAINGEVAALITSGQITAAGVCAELNHIAAAPGASTALQVSAASEAASLVAENLLTPAQVIQGFNSMNENSEAYWTVLGGLMANGNSALQSAAGQQAALLLHTEPASTVMGWIDHAVTSNGLTADQAVTALACIAEAAGNNAQVMSAISGELNTMIGRGDITGSQAMLDVIHLTNGLNMDLLSNLAQGDRSLQAAIGEALVLSGQSSQFYNVITSTALLHDPAETLAISLGVAAQATGSLQTAAEQTISTILSSGWVGWTATNTPQTHASLSQVAAVQVLGSVGAHADMQVQSIAANTIGKLAENAAPTMIMQTLFNTCPHTSDGLQFIGAALANMVAHGVSRTTVCDFVTGFVAGLGYNPSNWSQQVYGAATLSQADAETVFIDMAASGSAALRDTVASHLLSYGLQNDQTFLANHLADGLAQALLLKNVTSNFQSSTDILAHMANLETAFLQAHPGADAYALQCVSLAQLDLGLHAAMAATDAARATTPAGVTQQLNNLLGQINGSAATLGMVLTGCGMLQISQTSGAGINDNLNMAHQATIDYVMLEGVNTVGAALDGVAGVAVSYIQTGIDKGWDLATQKIPACGILKNEVIADPTNYQGYIDLYAQIYAAAAPTGIGVEVSLTSKLLTAGFESDAVNHVLGKTAAADCAFPFAMVAAGCTAITQAIAGVADYSMTNIVHTAISLGNVADDLAHGKSATDDATALGNGLLSLYTGGISVSQLTAATSDSDAMWSDIFHHRDASGDAAAFGHDMVSMVIDNPGVKAVTTAFENAFTSSAVTGPLGVVINQLTSAGNAIASTAESVGSAIASSAESVGSRLNPKSWIP
ncbi:MAG TPA: hypothetical protein VFB45_20340 [Pseudolabrys sp.]|nr:hypothetical protein [Pseudolabrys sp.]